MLWQTMRSEWVKLWSVRSTWWCLAGAAVLMMLATVTIGGSTATDMLNNPATAKQFAVGDAAITATVLAQFAQIALALLIITSEYASGAIRVTLQATPIRGRLLAAKALVVAPVVFVASLLLGAAAAAITYGLLSNDLFGGYATLPPVETALDMLRISSYLALMSVFALGVGTALRSAAGSLTVVFMLLMGIPVLLAMAGSQFAVAVSMRMPMFAGLAFMEGGDSSMKLASPGEGLVWLLAWTALGVAAGYVALRRRDA